MRASELGEKVAENADDGGLKFVGMHEEREGVLGPMGVKLGRERIVLARETASPASIANP